MSIVYLVFGIIDWTLIIVGNKVELSHFICYNNHFLVPADAQGAWYLIFQTLYYFSFSLMIWHLFYSIPKQYGLISNPLVKSILKRNNEGLNKSSVNTSSHIEQFFKEKNDEHISIKLASPKFGTAHGTILSQSPKRASPRMPKMGPLA